MSNEIILPPSIEIEITTPPKEVITVKDSPKTIIQMSYTAPGPQGIQGIQGEPGIQGLQGIQGIQGEQGIPGVASTYTHTQIAASTLWTIEHDLGKKPSVSVVDSAETLIMANIIYLDNNRCQVELSMAISGKAYCN